MGAGGQSAICTHGPTGHAGVSGAGRKYILAARQRHSGQGRDLIGMGHRIIRCYPAAGQLSGCIKHHPPDPGMACDPAVNHLRPAAQCHRQRLDQIAAESRRVAQALGRPQTAIRAQQAQGQRPAIPAARQQRHSTPGRG